MRRLTDDLGAAVELPDRVTRVVSLVPSLTESVAATAPGLLVGATDWCTHPADLSVARVRGTKNPDTRAIIDLRPDVVIANMEENREIDVRRLRDAGIAVWVTRIETLDDALRSLHRMIEEALDLPTPQWLAAAELEWAEPSPPSGTRVAVAVWRDPWMVVGRSTYTGDLLTRLGVSNAFGEDADRYPAVSLGRLTGGGVDLVLLPDEPYAFTADDGPEALDGTPSALVSGRLLTWYGPALVGARAVLESALAETPRRAHEGLRSGRPPLS
jgi:ABC-type Fe3+-hydroxamate transport system substrate-binding protein